MLFLSPSVNTNESDQTLSVKEVSNNVGAIAGAYQWGPVDTPTLITNGEDEFISKFGIPNDVTAKYVMPALDFFPYANALWVVRQVGPAARNAFPTAKTPLLIKNEDGAQTANLSAVDFIAKFPGTAGNGLTVDICDSANFSTWELNSQFTYPPLAGEFSVALVDTTGFWTGVAAQKQKERLIVSGSAAGTTVNVFGVAVTIAAADTAAQVAAKIAATAGFIALFDNVTVADNIITYTEKVAGLKNVRNAPASSVGLTFTTDVATYGLIGGVLERFEILQNSPTAKSQDGTSKFWFDVINQSSKYIRAGDKTVALTDRTVALTGGVDDQVVNVTSGFQQFKNREAFDLQFLIVPDVSVAEQKAAIDIAEYRGDCSPVIAPPMAAVVNNRGNEAAAIKAWRNTVGADSSYTVSVDNWGYMFDKYNQVYRWVPATGGTAGLMAKTFTENDPWVSPAGLTRGKYRNYSKMAWSASETDRNALYPIGVNSIVSFPTEGIVLFGDKTMTQRPSAFGHINVRWAFIVAKQSIAAMARYYLFELNNEFTRAQFMNAARPFLRNMKNRNAFEDFQIICNEVNNDGAVRAHNKMVVQLLLKPMYSINWVVLNLTAVRPDVSFTEVQ